MLLLSSSDSESKVKPPPSMISRKSLAWSGIGRLNTGGTTDSESKVKPPPSMISRKSLAWSGIGRPNMGGATDVSLAVTSSVVLVVATASSASTTDFCTSLPVNVSTSTAGLGSSACVECSEGVTTLSCESKGSAVGTWNTAGDCDEDCDSWLTGGSSSSSSSVNPPPSISSIQSLAWSGRGKAKFRFRNIAHQVLFKGHLFCDSSKGLYRWYHILLTGKSILTKTMVEFVLLVGGSVLVSQMACLQQVQGQWPSALVSLEGMMVLLHSESSLCLLVALQHVEKLLVSFFGHSWSENDVLKRLP
ncbi:hypothetical protein E2C01_021289 [Portunus trituberculatus]|uniref:Uncharacterized protein n=1 Tax=Portunus trituberculatus TaxID=210409 RepID=A0A5B7E494_PORTR|nr:hypothetical protein [Portunus trituberculatus]